MIEKPADSLGALLGTFQVIQAEFQESFAGFGFAPRMLQEFYESGSPSAIQMRGNALF